MISNRKTPPASSEAGRFLRFATTGGFAAAVNIGSRIGLSHVMRYELAVALAYLIGMTVAFLLAHHFVFHANGLHFGRSFTRFAAVNLLSFAQVWGISVGLAELLFPRIGFHWHPEELAHLIGVGSPVIVSYYAHKHFSFKRPMSISDGSPENASPQDA